jgi:hypothetical protein
MIKDRNHFPAWLTENGLTGTGVEVGTYYGQFAHHILTNWTGLQLIAVDPYINYPEDEYLDGCNLVNLEEAKQCAMELLKPFGDRFLLLNVPSAKAAGEFANNWTFASWMQITTSSMSPRISYYGGQRFAMEAFLADTIITIGWIHTSGAKLRKRWMNSQKNIQNWICN